MKIATVCAVASIAALSALADPAGPAHLLRDINQTPSSADPVHRTADSTTLTFAEDIGGRLVFFADDGVHGMEPWVTDGTEAGTHLVKDIHPGRTGSFNLTVSAIRAAAWRGRSYFDADDGIHGLELWSSDGTEAGTTLVKDINPSPNASSSPLELCALDSALVFSAFDPDHGRELWASDGTEAGTRLVKDILPGPDYSQPLDFVCAGDTAYFLAIDGSTSGGYLWKTDGTEAGTVRIALPADDEEYQEHPVFLDGAAWFITTPLSFNANSRLWRYDAVGGSLSSVEIPVGYALSLTSAGDKLFFVGFDEEAGVELWTSDGTTAGTRRLDISPGPESTGLDGFLYTGGKFYFYATNSEQGPSLWTSDGTEAGTVLLRDNVGNHNDSASFVISAVDGMVLFDAGDAEHGHELWRTDGTVAGTQLVQDLRAGPAGSLPYVFATFGHRVAFSAIDETAGREPWVGRAAILTHQPLRAIQDLGDEVAALPLSAGQRQSLNARLAAATAALDRPNGERTAVNALEAFAHEIEALSPRAISAAQAGELLDFAHEIEGLVRGGP